MHARCSYAILYLVSNIQTVDSEQFCLLNVPIFSRFSVIGEGVLSQNKVCIFAPPPPANISPNKCWFNINRRRLITMTEQPLEMLQSHFQSFQFYQKLDSHFRTVGIDIVISLSSTYF